MKKWIDINVHKPDCWSQHGQNYASGYILGYTKYQEIEIVQLLIMKDNYGINKYVWDADGGICEDINYITHWMNLPKPPIL